MNWAVIRTGGKQYKVTVGQTLNIEKLDTEGKESLTFDDVLMVNTDGKTTIGLPKVEKAKVRAKVVGDIKEDKIRVVKYKSKSRYTRTTGHRQKKTQIKIEKIES